MVTFDQYLIQKANEWTVEGWPVGNLLLCLGALVLCIILVGIIGVEREWRGRSAGLRTHLLVGVGSTIIMIISLYGFPAAFGEHRDVARLAAQVVTGVGFLGAGAIIHHNSGIRGLTTAGTIWAAMAIGIACGSFNFILAIFGTIVIAIVLTVFKKIEAKISNKNPVIVMSVPADKPALSKILAISKAFDCSVHSVSTTILEGSNPAAIEITFRAVFSSGEERLMEYVSKLEEETKAINVQILNYHHK